MLSRDYDYNLPSENYDISDERKSELIEKIKEQIRKKTIAHHKILKIGKNHEEYDFLYEFLDINEIKIRGINGTVSGNIPNYTHLPKMGQNYTPEKLDNKEQEELFNKLSQYSFSDRKNKNPEYIKIRDELIKRNMKLANWVTSWPGITKINVPLEDKKQLGYLGLIRAVELFDPTLGYKFSTYACKSIYRTIIREAYREAGFKYNNAVLEQLVMLTQIEDVIFNKLGREAKVSEIADILGVKLERVYNLYRLRSIQNKESLDEIEEKERTPEIDELSDGTRLYYKQGDKDEFGDGEISDGVYYEAKVELPVGFSGNDQVEDMAFLHILKSELASVIQNILSDREAEVIEMRYGLGKYKGAHTLEEVGKKFDVTKERIRQIEIKAIRKLRNIRCRRKIEDFGDINPKYYAQIEFMCGNFDKIFLENGNENGV